MKKNVPKEIGVKDEGYGTLMDVLQLACVELFPAIKQAGAKRCAVSICRLLMGILSKKNLY